MSDTSTSPAVTSPSHSSKKDGGFQKVKKEFQEELLQVSRVTKVTAGGRHMRFRAAVVIGDHKGRVGFGVGKSSEVVSAIEKAVSQAKKKLITVPSKNGTVPFEVKSKFKSAKVMIHPASEGTGIIAGGPTRRILELAGLSDVLAKRYGGNNIVTNAYATMKALEQYKHVS